MTTAGPTAAARKTFRKNLRGWYDAHRRAMPWRETRDPYRILLSEFMLQQTQVDTVIPYFNRFCERFPDVAALADAPLEDVLRLWEGLGYYARARNLHKAARAIVDTCGSRVPDTFDALSALPGFGPYTTAAVLSIAYGRPHAVVDGNVIRVLCRRFGITDDVTTGAVRRRLQELAQDLLDAEDPGEHNQAVMELGATVCTPKNPNCQTCPISRGCVARRDGLVGRIPNKPRAKDRPHVVIAAAIASHEDAVLLGRRPENGLLGGLWELPGDRVQDDETLADACVRGVQEKTDVGIVISGRYRTVRHAFSHFGITLHTFLASTDRTPGKPIGYDAVRWVPRDELGDVPATRTTRRLLDMYLGEPDLVAGTSASTTSS